MRYEIVQWVPDSTVHALKDCGQRKGEHYGDSTLVQDMKNWCSRVPNALKLITLTKRPGMRGNYQLRFWFGEPYSWRRDYVDSCGHNLVAHVQADSDLLLYQLLVEHILKEVRVSYTKETIEGVEVWRMK